MALRWHPGLEQDEISNNYGMSSNNFAKHVTQIKNGKSEIFDVILEENVEQSGKLLIHQKKCIYWSICEENYFSHSHGKSYDYLTAVRT